MQVEREYTHTETRYVVKAAKSFTVDGEVARPGALVEVDQWTAESLVNRKLAAYATAEECAAAGDTIKIARNGNMKAWQPLA